MNEKGLYYLRIFYQIVGGSFAPSQTTDPNYFINDYFYMNEVTTDQVYLLDFLDQEDLCLTFSHQI